MKIKHAIILTAICSIFFSCSSEEDINQKGEENTELQRGLNNFLIPINNVHGGSFNPNDLYQYSCSNLQLAELNDITTNTYFNPDGIPIGQEDLSVALNTIYYCSGPNFSTCLGATSPDEVWNVTFVYGENDQEYDNVWNPTYFQTNPITVAESNMFRDFFACKSIEYGDNNFGQYSSYRIANITTDTYTLACDDGDVCNSELIEGTASFLIYY